MSASSTARTGLSLILLVVSGSLSQAALHPREPPSHPGDALKLLNSMQVLMEGGEEFDPEYYQKLETCWNSLSSTYATAQDNAWGEMVRYFDVDRADDPWGGCQDDGNQTQPGGYSCHTYHEDNATMLNVEDVIIYEPCNYASNVAYYHVSTEICEHLNNGGWRMPEETAKAIGEVMSSLAFGSAFWHASHTITGNIMDNEIIQILAFILHQTMVAPLNSSNPIINDLSFDEKPSSAVELNEQLSDMFLTKPVEEWDDILSNMDKPSYWRTFAGIVSTFFTLVLDDETADEIILLLADLFSFPDDEYEFINGTFLPALRPLMSDIELTSIEIIQLDANFDSALIKLLYSFIWQEWVITDNPMLFEPEVNAKGAELLPVVNQFANVLNNFPEYDQNLQNSVHIYPGDAVYCNDLIPHAKWHLEAAPGLTDLIYLADDVFNAIEQALMRRK